MSWWETGAGPGYATFDARRDGRAGCSESRMSWRAESVAGQPLINMESLVEPNNQERAR